METLKSAKEKTGILIFLVFIGCIGITFVPAIPQDPNYHVFADQRTFMYIDNFWNVVSNFPFVVTGIVGLVWCLNKRRIRWNYVFFFAGILLTGFGSSWYHLHPDNETLLWDRLPMTISFTSFFSIIICECVTERSENLVLFQLLVIGIFSVFYWEHTEHLGKGDLRLYILVQFLPMILIPLIILTFRPRPAGTIYLWLMFLAYALAKLCESYDDEIFLFFLSGHTIKHLFAALAPVLFLARMNKCPAD